MNNKSILNKLKILKNNKALLDQKELRSIIGGNDGDAISNKGKFNNKTGAIMILSIGVIFTSAFLLFNSGGDTSDINKTSLTTEQQPVTIELQKPLEENLESAEEEIRVFSGSAGTVYEVDEKTKNTENIHKDEIIEETASDDAKKEKTSKVWVWDGEKLIDGESEEGKKISEKMNKDKKVSGGMTFGGGGGAAKNAAGTSDIIKPQTIPYDEIPYVELSINQAKKLGITIDSKCNFTVEEIYRIHPIDLRIDYFYRNKPETQELLRKNYDTTGKLFLKTTNFSLELSDNDAIKKYERVLSQLKKKYAGMPPGVNTKDHEEVDRYVERTEAFENAAKIKTNEEVQEYTGQDIHSFKKITPIWVNCKYKNSDDVMEWFHSSAIIKEYKNNSSYPALNEVVPVRINLPETDPYGNEYLVDHIDFWFLPTKEFLDALPQDIAQQIKNEKEILELLNIGMPAKEACKGIDANTSFFQICGLHSGAVSIIKAYPNPAESFANVQFELEEERTISFAVFDANGNKKIDIANDSKYQKGTYETTINLSSLQAGMYIISFTTTQGENCSVRIVKK